MDHNPIRSRFEEQRFDIIGFLVALTVRDDRVNQHHKPILKLKMVLWWSQKRSKQSLYITKIQIICIWYQIDFDRVTYTLMQSWFSSSNLRFWTFVSKHALPLHIRCRKTKYKQHAMRKSLFRFGWNPCVYDSLLLCLLFFLFALWKNFISTFFNKVGKQPAKVKYTRFWPFFVQKLKVSDKYIMCIDFFHEPNFLRTKSSIGPLLLWLGQTH